MDGAPLTTTPQQPTAPAEPSGPILIETELAAANTPVDDAAASGGAAAGPERESRLGVLRHKHYRTILLAAFGSYVGSWFEFVAVRWIVSQETKSEVWMGYLAAAQLCPTLLLGMMGGLVADSVNRRTLLIVTQACMMAIALAMAGVAYFGYADRWTLLGLTLAQGVTVAFNMPAWQVLTPRLVPKSDLTKAITLNGIAFNMARVIGPAIGGVIMKAFQSPAAAATLAATAIIAADVATTAGGAPDAARGAIYSRGAAALLFFNALTFIGVMAAVLTTPDAPAPKEMRGAWKHPAVVWTRSKEAIAWVWTRKGPRSVFLAIVVFATLATPIMQLLPLMVSEVYHKQEGTFGTMLTVMGVGAVCGGLGMKFIPKWYPMHHFIPVSILAAGLFVLIFALMTDVAAATTLMFFIGIFWMWGFNSSAAAIQHLVSDDMRGRVSAVVNTIAVGFMPLGTWIAGGAGHAGERILKSIRPEMVHSGTGTQIGLAFVAAVLVIAGLIMLIWRTPEVDGLRPGDKGYDRRPGLVNGLLATAHRPTRPEKTT